MIRGRAGPLPPYPQQMHLDIRVGDLDAVDALVIDRGATRLADFDDHRVYADVVGHPFCLYPADVAKPVLSRLVIDAPDPDALPPDRTVLLDRGPFTLDGELRLVDEHALDVLVTKDSGGEMTQAKLAAARARGLPVIVVARPPRPDAQIVQTVEEALAWLGERAHGDG